MSSELQLHQPLSGPVGARSPALPGQDACRTRHHGLPEMCPEPIVRAARQGSFAESDAAVFHRVLLCQKKKASSPAGPRTCCCWPATTRRARIVYLAALRDLSFASPLRHRLRRRASVTDSFARWGFKVQKREAWLFRTSGCTRARHVSTTFAKRLRWHARTRAVCT